VASATDQAYANARDPLANVYNSAIKQGTELENAVSNRLKGVGDTRTADFAARLAQMGAPQTGAAEELATKYKGADAAGFAKGMNDVGRLVSRGAEARGFLEKQPGLARQQSQAELAKSLDEMFKGYTDETGDIMAKLPGEVQSIYDKLFGNATSERNDQNQNAWQQVKFIQEQLAANQEAKVVAATLGDKKAVRAAAANDKALNRELQRWKAQLSAETSLATDNPPAPTTKVMGNKTYQYDQATGKWVPIGKAPTGTGPKPDKPKVTPQYVLKGVADTVFPGEGNGFNGWDPKLVKRIKGSPKQIDGIIQGAINNAIRGFNIDPNSPQGKNVRTSILKRLNGRGIPGVGIFEWP
jgi:hypothetical protein